MRCGLRVTRVGIDVLRVAESILVTLESSSRIVFRRRTCLARPTRTGLCNVQLVAEDEVFAIFVVVKPNENDRIASISAHSSAHIACRIGCIGTVTASSAACNAREAQANSKRPNSND